MDEKKILFRYRSLFRYSHLKKKTNISNISKIKSKVKVDKVGFTRAKCSQTFVLRLYVKLKKFASEREMPSHGL